jgi:acetoacetyl-CoA reductase
VAANYNGNDIAAEKFRNETNIPTYKWSVKSYEQCESGVASIEADLGNISVLVNNAGITRDVMFHKMTSQMWHDVIDTNLNGLFNMTHPVWKGMRNRGFGRIINLSSINGQKGALGQVNYSSSKSGDLGFTKALALEGAAKGITVNSICPGYIATDMLKSMPEKLIESTVSQIPVGRLGEPDEIARCVIFLASTEASFITGSTMTVNGGQFIF